MIKLTKISILALLFLFPFSVMGAGINSNTYLMLHFNGNDGDTSTTDSGLGANCPHTITLNGTAQLDNTSPKFGSTDLMLDGDSDSATSGDSADWDILGSNAETNVYTLEGHFWFGDHAGVEMLICHLEDDENYWALRHVDGAGLRFFLISNNAFVLDTGSGGEITETANYHYVAVVIIGNGTTKTVGLYVDVDNDGTAEQVAYTQDDSIDSFTGNLEIGYQSTQEYYFYGHADEVRLYEGNPHGANPDAGLSDSIVVPAAEYSEEKGQVI